MSQKASVSSFTAIAHPNIAHIKYWGNRDDDLRLPANGSISMNLAGLTTRTTVSLDPDLQRDKLVLNGQLEQGVTLTRVSTFLDVVRDMAGSRSYAHIKSRNDFPTGAGIASSASALPRWHSPPPPPTVWSFPRKIFPGWPGVDQAPPAAPCPPGSPSGKPGHPTRIPSPPQ